MQNRKENMFTVFVKEWWSQFTEFAFSPDDEGVGMLNGALIMAETLGLAMYALSSPTETVNYVFHWWHIPAGLLGMCVAVLIEIVIASAISSIFVAVAETIRWLRRDKRGY